MEILRKFLGDDTDDIEDITDLILYLVSPVPALFQEDHSTAQAWMASSHDEAVNTSESWATGDVHGDIPESQWDLAYHEGNDPWWGETDSSLEDSVNGKPADDGSKDINQSWGDNVVPYEKGWECFDEWDETQNDPMMKDFLGELENELDKTFEPSGGSGATPCVEDPTWVTYHMSKIKTRIWELEHGKSNIWQDVPMENIPEIDAPCGSQWHRIITYQPNV